ncbi:very short patch repair endonuclease [Bordetella hinzii]|uniref:very short patch repair endonuclease n=1 Tax=Bordetella hinzii TaxID=103855 RepID=UPI0039FC0669
MTDIWTPAKRSEVMGKVRSKGNRSTELRLIEVFRELGISGWRRNQTLPGKPDFTFRTHKLCVFVDGCFWHGCSRCYRRPASSQEYWDAKIQRNQSRDSKVNRELRARGWKILRIWEHELRPTGRKNLFRRLRRYGLWAPIKEKGNSFTVR